MALRRYLKIFGVFLLLTAGISVTKMYFKRRLQTRHAPATIDWSVDTQTRLSKIAVRMLTSRGEIYFKFYPDDAPVSVRRIAELVRSGFYNGLTFHRVIPGFIVQTGDPTNTGRGGSGLPLKAEFNANTHVEGTIGLARGAEQDSADSQFYIALSAQPQLDRQYTVIGQVIEGFDVLKKIELGDAIQSAELVMMPDPDPLPEDATVDPFSSSKAE